LCFSITAKINFKQWIDNKLKWDPAQFNYIKSVHIPAEKLWKPDILLVNNADSWAKISSISTNAIVKHNGNVTWLSTVIFKSSCSINVRYFPFGKLSNIELLIFYIFSSYIAFELSNAVVFFFTQTNQIKTNIMKQNKLNQTETN
jgi:hypothetical protein